MIMGYAVSASAVAGVFYSCKQQSPSGEVAQEAATSVFSSNQKDLITAIAEHIIPKTDTPGATDVGVADYIDLIVSDVYEPKHQTAFTEGLAQMDEEAQAAHKKNFLDCSPEEQEALLQVNSKKAVEAMETLEKGAPRPFFMMMRELTLLGYFTSEEVGKNILVYEPVPGQFQGCIPLEEVGNETARAYAL